MYKSLWSVVSKNRCGTECVVSDLYAVPTQRNLSIRIIFFIIADILFTF